MLQRILSVSFCLAWAAQLAVLPAFAVTLENDPKGFGGIPWGTALADRPDLVLADPGERVKGYEQKEGPSSIGETPVDSMRLVTVEGKFARVMIRYRGQAKHDQILAYLQGQYGPIDRTPGQMARGLNQQYTWRGSDTEINLTYQAAGERGFLFIESRTLAPRFNDSISDAQY